jgi:hypothetical protein
MEAGGTICVLVVIIIFSVGLTMLIYFLKHLMYKGVDSVVYSIHRVRAKRQ